MKIKIADQADDYITGCLLDYNYFWNYYKTIAIDLSKQKRLDADPKAIQQINFSGNLEEQSIIFFHYWRSKKICLRFFTRNFKNIII